MLVEPTTHTSPDTKSSLVTKDTILFCIDASESMQQIPDAKGARSHLHNALQCALDVMKRKVITRPNDSVGILLFNTVREETNGDQAMKNHWLYLPVGPLSADTMLQLMNTLDDAATNPSSLRGEFAPKPAPSIAIGDVFASCNQVLREGAPKTAIKRIFYVTDEDNPGSPEQPSWKRLEDLVAQGISIVPFFISTDEKPFDVNKFYAPVFTAGGNDEDTLPFGDVCEGFEGVIAEMRIREMAKRAMWSIPMEIADGLTIGIKGYGLVMEQRKPQHRYMAGSGATAEEVVSRRTYFDKEQQNTILDAEVLYGLPSKFESTPTSGGENEGGATKKPTVKAVFTASQIRELKTLGLKPGIKVLGFKDSSYLQFEDNTKHAYFLYPDEGRYLGSTRTFSALLKSLVKQNKIGICRVMMRINSTPLFCALVPQVEKLDEDGIQDKPPGLHLIPLPFADEIRDAPITEAYKASSELVDAATQILKKLTLKNGYNPNSFTNPALALHFAQVEAHALTIPFDPDSIEDPTLPNYDHIHSKTAKVIEKWGEVLENEDAAQLVGKASRKRAAAETDDAYDESEIRSRYEEGTLAKLTVAVMKDFLKAKGAKAPTGAKKADLLELLTSWLEAHPAK
ncbi:ku70-like protein [Clavulina sp. PMI_390]|nr:ku70-like protein [Clavulina sp. PMI_390]